MRLFIIFLLTFSYTLNAQEYANYKVDKAYAIEIHNKARKKVKDPQAKLDQLTSEHKKALLGESDQLE